MKKILFLLAVVAGMIGFQYLFRQSGNHQLLVASAGYLYLVWLASYSHLTRQDLGLYITRKQQTYLWAIIVLGVIFLVSGLISLLLPEAFRDQRYNQSIGSLFIAIFVYLPLSVVVYEEILFRGAIFGFFNKYGGKKQGIIVSSVLFGLWHLPSSADFQIDQILFLENPSPLLVRTAIVVITAAVGWGFCELRLRSQSLAIPIVAHWSLNAAGMLFAFLSWRFS